MMKSFEEFIKVHESDLEKNILMNKTAHDFLNIINDTIKLYDNLWRSDIRKIFIHLIMYKYFPDKQSLTWLIIIQGYLYELNSITDSEMNYYWEKISDEDIKFECKMAASYCTHSSNCNISEKEIYEYFYDFCNKKSLLDTEKIYEFLIKYAKDSDIKYELGIESEE